MFDSKNKHYEIWQKEWEFKINESHQRLQQEIENLKENCQDQAKILEAIDKKLQYLCLAADGEFADVRQSIKRLNRKLELLEVNVHQQHRWLKLGLKKLKTTLTEEQQQRENRLIEELYEYYNHVLERKISKNEMADLLLEISENLEIRRNYAAHGKISPDHPPEQQTLQPDPSISSEIP